MPVKFVALGLDHRHIYGMTANMLAVGAECLGYWTEGDPFPRTGFTERFPQVKRFESLEHSLQSGADLALIACKPMDRCALAEAAMRCGMDVMVDKPGCITHTQLDSLKRCVAETRRIWSVNFSERFEVPSVTRATELIAEGAIGRVVHTAGFGPHRLNKATRPDWFFDRTQYGGILTDIASHQIDQFLHFTNSTDAEVTHAFVANYANPKTPGLQDFGEVSLCSDNATGSIRVDWFTPEALPTWGDGRLIILGTDGYMELRKYVDVASSDRTDQIILVNGTDCQRIDASNAELPYFSNLHNDVLNRTDTAMTQDHCFQVMDLALTAQELAESRLS
ncbi:MAG: Gfo/Idh/MocA family oxidoreductase [Roseobacter sp.]|jgi:predicted dehydrogenase|nr:Gfo/Idh/MocA family oxidoreductase [Roseobacter sp.]